MNKKLGDFGIKTDNPEYEKETQTLGALVGQTLEIVDVESKKLGTYDGVIFTLAKAVVDGEGEEWDKVHTTKAAIVAGFKDCVFDEGDVLTVKVVGGKGSKGKDWYDIKDV